MATRIFVNLPVADLEKSKKFFEALGFTINPQFSDETGACVVFSEDIYAMILTHDKFKSFTKKGIADATKTAEEITALSVDSKEEVDQMIEKAVAAGGKETRKDDYGFMYGKAFEDLDGHIWEVFWMDITKAPPSPGK